MLLPIFLLIFPSYRILSDFGSCSFFYGLFFLLIFLRIKFPASFPSKFLFVWISKLQFFFFCEFLFHGDSPTIYFSCGLYFLRFFISFSCVFSFKVGPCRFFYKLFLLRIIFLTIFPSNFFFNGFCFEFLFPA